MQLSLFVAENVGKNDSVEMKPRKERRKLVGILSSHQEN